MTLIGKMAASVPDRALARLIAVANRRFEPEMSEIVRACDPDGTAVDVGAWFGPWTYWLARRVDRVVAFEANPEMACRLRSTVAANVTVHAVAVSDAAGTVEFSISGTGLGSEGRSSVRPLPDAARRVHVPSATLDSFDLDRVRLLKVDVEGHEFEALSGARRTIERWRPVVVVELEERHASVARTVALMRSLGYAGRVKVAGSWRSLGGFDLVASQRTYLAGGEPRGYLRTLLAGGAGYVNNVVFAHPENTWTLW
ncbi:MAG: hypothetical protein QOD92_3152 [Acidimicrobiaceae bacterium]|jgi:FkbM family methyltransferase